MPETDIETERQVRRLEEQFKRLTITDSEGDLESGFAIRIEPISVVTTATTGACCFPDGFCEIDSPTDCSNFGGIYQGDGTVCDPNPCPQPTGACCFADGSCVIHTSSDCSGLGGTYQGDETVCSPNPCPSVEIRRCCFCDGTCLELSHSDCLSAGGMWGSSGTTCAGCSGGVPCCVAWRITGQIVGTITFDDGVNTSCSWNINDTLTYDSFCQDSGCDGMAYPGCCIALASGGLGPVSESDHTTFIGFNGADNFNETSNLSGSMQVNPDWPSSPCNTAATVTVTVNTVTDVDCNGSYTLTGNSNSVSGFTSWNLNVTISVVRL